MAIIIFRDPGIALGDDRTGRALGDKAQLGAQQIRRADSIIVRPAVSKLIVPHQGMPAKVAASAAARYSSGAEMVSIQSTSTTHLLRSRSLRRSLLLVRLLCDEAAALARPQVRIEATAGDKFGVAAVFDNAPLVKNEQPVHGRDRR